MNPSKSWHGVRNGARHDAVLLHYHPGLQPGAVLAGRSQSVLSQSCQDFEIVVVDDGSCDGHGRRSSRELPILASVISRQKNCGGGAARNAGIDAARGRLSRCSIPTMNSSPAISSAWKRCWKMPPMHGRLRPGRGEPWQGPQPPQAAARHRCPGEHMATYLLCDRGFVPPSPSRSDRAQIAQRVRYSEHLRFGEDTDFAIRLFLAGCRFVDDRRAGCHLARLARSEPRFRKSQRGAACALDRAIAPGHSLARILRLPRLGDRQRRRAAQKSAKH